jgi:hypothetical protein
MYVSMDFKYQLLIRCIDEMINLRKYIYWWDGGSVGRVLWNETPEGKNNISTELRWFTYTSKDIHLSSTKFRIVPDILLKNEPVEGTHILMKWG